MMPAECSAATPEMRLVADLQALLGTQLGRRVEAGIQSIALQQPHSEKKEGRAGLLAAKNLIDRTQVWVNHRAGEKDFLLKAGCDRSIGSNFRSDDFDCDAGVLQQYIACLIDLSHTTASNEANDFEAIGDELRRRKASGGNCRDCGGNPGLAILNKQGLAEKAAGELVLKKQLLDQAAQPGHAPACVIKKRGPLLRL